MRSYDEYKQIMELWEAGVNKKAISRITQIPRRTIIDCIQRYENLETLEQISREQLTPLLLKILRGDLEGDYSRIHHAYAYLLGIYLGDGNISKVRNVLRLRVTLDARYPNIVELCKQELECLFPDNQVGIVKSYYREKLSYVNVSLFYKYWDQIIPQHDIGHKHERKIELVDWQQRIVAAHALEFLRGLFHSDGSRFDNVVNGKAYPRYQFTNVSTDIIKLFCDTCDRLGIHWTSKVKQPKNPNHHPSIDIFISKRKDVAYLDSVIGAKS